MNEITDKGTLVKLKNFSAKDNAKRIRRQATDWEKIFAKTHLIKDLYPKELQNTTIKKQHNLKNEPKTLTDLSPKKTMANMHMKRLSTAHAIREVQIKATMRYLNLLIRMARIWNTFNTKCWWGYGATGTLLHCWWECKIVLPLWKTVWQRLTKLNYLLPYDPPITLRGIILKGVENICPHEDLHGNVYSSFIHDCQNLKQPTCPL